MHRKIVPVFLALALATAPALADSGAVAELTVYPDQVSVTRVLERALAAGENDVVFEPLPEGLLDATLRVAVSGVAGLTLVDAQLRGVHKRYTNTVALARLDAARRDLETRVAWAERLRAVLERELKLLDEIRVGSIADVNKDIKERRATAADWGSVADYVAGRIAAKTRELFDHEQSLERLRTEKTRVDLEYSQVYQGNPESYKRATVRVRAAAAGPCRVALTYLQAGASWKPGYDLRLGADGKLALSCFGTVRQRTGEPWTGVKLALSTAQPRTLLELPQLRPWLLSLLLGLDHYKTRGGSMPGTKFYTEDGDESKSKKDKFTREKSEDEQTTLRRDETAVTFEVPGNVTVPNDGTAIRKLLLAAELAATLTYKATPQLSPEVFVEATVKNATGAFLLPGAGQLYRAGTYLGAATVPATAPNGEFKLAYGVDPGLSTAKELLEQKLDPGGDNDVFYKYKLSVKNTKSVAVKVSLADALPVASNTDISVKMREISLKPTTQTEQGLCTWELEIAPGAETVIVYQVRITYPSKKRIIGLR